MKQWQQFNFTLTEAKTKVISDPAARPDNDTMRRSRFRDWIVKVRRLVKVLRQQLDHTVDESNTFCDTHAIYFQSLPSQDPSRPLLPEIQRHFRELAAQKKKLVGLAERCDDFAQDVSY
jgi:hypothetical protein